MNIIDTDPPFYRFELNSEGVLLSLNSALQDLLNLSQTELSHYTTLHSLFPPLLPFFPLSSAKPPIKHWLGPIEYPTRARPIALEAIITLSPQPNHRYHGYLTPLWKSQKQNKHIQQLEGRLRALYQAVNQMIVVLDRNHRILEFNQTAADSAVLRFGRRMCQGEDFINYVQPDRIEDFYLSFRAALEGQHVFKERLIFAPDRQGYTYEMTYTPIYSDSGEITSVYFVGVNVEERRQTQLLLNQEQSFVSSILNATNALIVVADQSGKVIRFNKACEEITGYPAADVLEHRLWEFLIPAEEQTQVQEAYHQILQGEFQANNLQFSFLTRTGIQHPISWSVNTMQGLDENTLYVVATGIDLTERLATEEALRESEAMLRQAQKMEAVGHLAGGIAHDFNNLLTAIMGYGQLLEVHLPAKSEGQDYLKEIQRMCHNARDLTRQLLMFSRKAPVETQVLNIHQVLEDMQGLLWQILGDKISLNLQLSENPGLVRANVSHLEQVMMNLVVNAHDAIEDRGVVTISSCHRRLPQGHSDLIFGHFKAGEYLCLQLSDTGCGMDPQTQKSIFDPFFTTKEKGKGTGLGMAVVYRIMKELGGWVQVQSQVGKGTDFQLFFPLYQEELSQNPHADRVLLHHLPTLQEQKIRHYLTRNGYQVYQGNHLTELQNLLEQTPAPRLLITELSRYDSQAIRTLLLRYPQLKFLYLSGDSEEEMALLEQLSAQEDVLLCPFFENQLLFRIEAMLENHLYSQKPAC